jgi:osmotically-inducible protein OsmY
VIQLMTKEDQIVTLSGPRGTCRETLATLLPFATDRWRKLGSMRGLLLFALLLLVLGLLVAHGLGVLPTGPRLDEATREQAARAAESAREDLAAVGRQARDRAAGAVEVGEDLVSDGLTAAATAVDEAVARGQEALTEGRERAARAGSDARDHVREQVRGPVEEVLTGTLEQARAKVEDLERAARARADRLLADAALVTAIKALLFADPELRAASIAVSVEDGVVTLRGTVASPALRVLATRIAGSPDGVREVVDELEVAAPPAGDLPERGPERDPAQNPEQSATPGPANTAGPAEAPDDDATSPPEPSPPAAETASEKVSSSPTHSFRPGFS